MKKQLKKHIISPVLNTLGLYSKQAEALIWGTAGVESNFGEYISQYPCGKGLGIYQMELATAQDIYKNFLNHRPTLKTMVNTFFCEGLTLEENLKGNLYFATALCRIHYFRVKEPLPTTLEDMARYWKRYYNTKLGAGTEDKFIKAYKA